MKVALISDIHANLPALEAVLKDAHERGVEAIWNTGDMLGYGAFPNEVLELLLQENVQSVIGNYDTRVLKVRQKKRNWKDGKPSDKWLAYSWTYKNLSKGNRDYLTELPNELRLEIEGRKALLTHGSPESDEEQLTPDTPAERFSELASKADADIIILSKKSVKYGLSIRVVLDVREMATQRQAMRF
jgi:predicted phosphodiesterase